jgi:hypothetical protein
MLQNPGARVLEYPRRAVAVGGTRDITMLIKIIYLGYIENGGTPNLMSIGRKVLKDSNGDSRITIFTTKGAVLI